jgi:RHS repeat-associated protein
MIRATNSDADVRFQRDLLGRVVTEVCNGKVLASAYDLLGRRVHRRTPSGAEARWQYDWADRAAALQTAGRMLRFAYDAAGHEVQRRIGTGAVIDQRWDAAHRLSSQTVWDAPTAEGSGQARLLQHRAYSYRADGSVLGIADQSFGIRRFDHDSAGRVTTVSAQGWSERYAYDEIGNVSDAAWSVPHDGVTPDADAIGRREYSGTLIRRAGNIRYEHDAQGRVILRQHRRLSSKPLTWRYIWGPEDRLVGAVTPDGRRWRYCYDALGRRIAKQRLAWDGRTVAEQTDFTWDGVVLAEQAHVDHEAGEGMRVTAWECEPSSFRAVSQTERMPLGDASQQWVDQQFYGIVTDLVGTTTEMVDPEGELVWRPRANLWGSQLAEPRQKAYCHLRSPGQYFDPETGLNYNYHRYYDSSIARYGTADPLGLTPQPNPHAYVHDPTALVDPLGLAPYDFKD